ncbi:hypothetical protein NKH70_34220 [Mesorhizobium sp. M0991]|uniref:hypothetical protein n=1 Tax=Mesorhizobium sp. M0991 TaxID=2957043 RepID=UPI00333B13E8
MLQTDPEGQRRIAEMEAARTSKAFLHSLGRLRFPSFQPTLDGAAPGQSDFGTEDKRLAVSMPDVDRRTVAPDRVAARASPYELQARRSFPPRSSPESAPAYQPIRQITPAYL